MVNIHRSGDLPNSNRVYDGEPATIESNPWLVSIQYENGYHFCGGSIISKDAILTAAHCTMHNTNSPILVRAGSTNHTAGRTLHPVAYVYQHPGYEILNAGIPVNDISILKLTTPINFTKEAQPIDLFEQYEESPVGAMATISGWGLRDQDDDPPQVMYTVSIPIVDKKRCNQMYRKFIGTLPFGQICAGYEDSAKNSCPGDSGSPVVIDRRQAGVVSWGVECGLALGYPGVYTEVAAYRDWIALHAGV